jgi:hypothetical protein
MHLFCNWDEVVKQLLLLLGRKQTIVVESDKAVGGASLMSSQFAAAGGMLRATTSDLRAASCLSRERKHFLPSPLAHSFSRHASPDMPTMRIFSRLRHARFLSCVRRARTRHNLSLGGKSDAFQLQIQCAPNRFRRDVTPDSVCKR